MSDAEVGDRARVPHRNRVTRYRWRVALIAVTLVMAAFSWHDPLVAVFAVIPVVTWCWRSAPSERTGIVVGLVLLALAAWILLPRALASSGRWVPSVFEVCVFLPILTAVICAKSMRSGGWLPAMGFSAFAVAGLVGALYSGVLYSEGDTGDEGVWPGPPGLHVVEGDKQCGSGGCARQFDATGDHAPDRTRAYLASRGFVTPGLDKLWTCRVTGLVLTYKVCAKVQDISPTTVRVTWSVQ